MNNTIEPPRGKIITAGLSEIEEGPGPFCMSFNFDLGPMVKSIGRCGLLNPPLVVGTDKGAIRVVAGWRRCMAVRSLEWTRLPCLDLSGTGKSEPELLLINLWDNLATRGFNAIEKGMVLSRLRRYLSEEEVLRDYMPLLGLPHTRNALDLYQRLDGLQESEKRAVVEDRLSLKALEHLFELDEAARISVLGFFNNLRLNFNQQLQIIDILEDVSSREKKDIPSILNEGPIRELVGHKALNGPQKTKAVLHLLKTRRYPRLAGYEASFQQSVSRLGLPGNVRVQNDPFFESPHHRLEIRFRDGRELRKSLQELCSRPGLEEIGRFEKGEGE